LQVNIKEAHAQFQIIQESIDQIQKYLMQADFDLITNLRLNDLSTKTFNLAQLIYAVTNNLVNALADASNGLYNALLLNAAELTSIQSDVLKKNS